MVSLTLLQWYYGFGKPALPDYTVSDPDLTDHGDGLLANYVDGPNPLSLLTESSTSPEVSKAFTNTLSWVETRIGTFKKLQRRVFETYVALKNTADLLERRVNLRGGDQSDMNKEPILPGELSLVKEMQGYVDSLHLDDGQAASIK